MTCPVVLSEITQQTLVCWCLCESGNVFAYVFVYLSVYMWVGFAIVLDGIWLAQWAEERRQWRLSQAHRPAFKGHASVCIQYVCSPWAVLKCHQPKCPGWECVLPLTLLQEGIRLTTLTCHQHHASHLHIHRENINTTGWNWDICYLLSDRKDRYAFLERGDGCQQITEKCHGFTMFLANDYVRFKMLGAK